MHGVKRVIAFCCLVAVVPTCLIILPLYLKNIVFKDMAYSVAESDILEVRDGISTIFCQEHILKMNTSFNAFQLNQMPEASQTRKHIRLKKSMILPDDTLEYWGFYLMKGATVELKVCSRFEGSRLLVVKGERNLRTCGLLEHNMEKYGALFNSEKAQVKVTFETAAEVIDPNIMTREENVRLTDDDGGGSLSPGDDEAQFNHGGEDLSDLDELQRGKHNDFKQNYLKHDKNEIENSKNSTITEKQTTHSTIETRDVDKASSVKKHTKRHKLKRKLHEESNEKIIRNKRQQQERLKRDTILDRGINHGGNAQSFKPKNSTADSSTSSFENALLECYDGQILVAKYFPPSQKCQSVKYLEQGAHLVSTHEVNTDGYYYYIFYSDNDDDSNHIHAVFDIFKPTYLYSNISETKGCINSTECHFPIQLMSDEVVIVEVPTRDGIEHEDDDITLLVSQCVPRMTVYVIFPVLVLVFILGCAFI